MEQNIYELLEKYNLSIATAESCTGGLIAATLVNVPGISGYFGEGYITYSNEAKEKLLGVSHATLEQYGAVSSQTAEEMAKGAKQAAGTDISVISTGIAGPDGGTEDKPVGLVYLACAYEDGAPSMPCGKIKVTPSGHPSMPCGGIKVTPSGHPSMPCGKIKVTTERHQFSGNRQEIRAASVHAALKLVIKVIEQNYAQRSQK